LSTSASAPALASFSAANSHDNNNTGRRSSLKPQSVAVKAGETVVDDSDEDEDEDEDPNGSLDMDMTRFETTAAYDADGRRKSVSHSRRVSFAPNAHIR
jgi:hypothetical protein